MPIYEYTCHDCNRRVSLLWRSFAEAQERLQQTMSAAKRRLEHALQVRRITLYERHLFCQRLELDAPGDGVVGTRDLEQAVEAACDGR